MIRTTQEYRKALRDVAEMDRQVELHEKRLNPAAYTVWYEVIIPDILAIKTEIDAYEFWKRVDRKMSHRIRKHDDLY